MRIIMNQKVNFGSVFHYLLLVICGTGMFVNTQASMVLDKMIVYFNANQRYQDIVVTNPDKEPLYLKTSVVEVLKPGTPKEKRMVITDPIKMTMLASPHKVVIPPNQSKTIRLVNLNEPLNREKVYRVNFTPVIGKIKATKTAVKILIGYQALVFVRPEKGFIQVSSKPSVKKITFINTGDVNVLLRNGKYCPKGTKKNKCLELKTDSNRLYAGQSWTVKLPPEAKKNGAINFGLYDGKREHDERFSLSGKTISNLIGVG